MATPPDFTAGQVLTAAQMDAIGLWLVKKETIGSAVSSVTITNAFSADYQNYKIVVSGGVASTTNSLLAVTLGATVTGYYYTFVYSTYATATPLAIRNSNAASFAYGGHGSTNTLSINATIQMPFETKRTIFASDYVAINTGGTAGRVQGFLDNDTSYTDFTITPNTGTLTGGTVFVYGMRA